MLLRTSPLRSVASLGRESGGHRGAVSADNRHPSECSSWMDNVMAKGTTARRPTMTVPFAHMGIAQSCLLSM